MVISESTWSNPPEPRLFCATNHFGQVLGSLGWSYRPVMSYFGLGGHLGHITTLTRPNLTHLNIFYTDHVANHAHPFHNNRNHNFCTSPAVHTLTSTHSSLSLSPFSVLIISISSSSRCMNLAPVENRPNWTNPKKKSKPEKQIRNMV
jgi:hypothetical protein